MKVHQTFTIDPQVARALDEVAQQTDTSKSETASKAISEYLHSHHPVIAEKYRKEEDK